MKWMLIIPLLFLQFHGISQTGKHAIISKTDKEIYLLGETIKIHMKSETLFQRMNDGNCNNDNLAPSYIEEMDGKWEDPEMPDLMECGFRFTDFMVRETNCEMIIEKIGHYKIVVFTDKGPIISNVFEVLNH